MYTTELLCSRSVRAETLYIVPMYMFVPVYTPILCMCICRIIKLSIRLETEWQELLRIRGKKNEF